MDDPLRKHFPKFLPRLSTSKKPHLIFSKLVKLYFAEKNQLNKEDVFLVTLMFCLSKKGEITREKYIGEVDAVLTVNEFADMVKQYEIDWNDLPYSDFDSILNDSSGASIIYKSSGRFLEAVIRLFMKF
jgi:iron only hydrogenase large subunit-like protein